MFHAIFIPMMCLLAATASPLANAITPGEVDELQALVSTDTGLDEEARTQLSSQLTLARSQLDMAADFRLRTTKLNADIEQAPAQAATFDRKLEAAKASKEEDDTGLVAQDSSVDDIEGQTTLVTAERQSLLERRSQLINTVAVSYTHLRAHETF